MIQVNLNSLTVCHPERQRRVSISVVEMLRFAQHDRMPSEPIRLIEMSKKLCLLLSIVFTAIMLLAACAPAAAPTAAPTAPVQPTTTPAGTAALVQPTTATGEIPQSGDLCGGTGGN